MTFTEIPLLAELLEDAGVSKKSEIEFRIEYDGDDPRYTVECEDEAVAERVATFFGCPEDEFQGEPEFDAEDHWHGTGEGNLVELIKELEKNQGSDFEKLTLSVGQILRMAN